VYPTCNESIFIIQCFVVCWSCCSEHTANNFVPISQRCAPLLVRTFTVQTVKQNTDWPVHKRSPVSLRCPVAVQYSCLLLYCKCELLLLEGEFITSKGKFPLLERQVITSKGKFPLLERVVITSKGKFPLLEREVIMSKGKFPLLERVVITSKGKFPLLEREVITSKGKFPLLERVVITSKGKFPLLERVVITSKGKFPIRTRNNNLLEKIFQFRSSIRMVGFSSYLEFGLWPKSTNPLFFN
jgi:hypothetical protein